MTAPRAAAAGIDFEPRRLREFLEQAMPGLAGAMRLERIGGGQSNPTYFVTFDNRNFVLRKRPPGDLPRSAHDVQREYRMTSAVAPVGVPVPRPILFHEATDVVGTPFYLMERVDGRTFHQSALPGLTPEQRRRTFDALARGLAALHRVDWGGAGLGDMARPGSFVARQVERWLGAWGDLARSDPALVRIGAWLRANQPPDSASAIVHGDFKFNNLIFAAETPDLLAVLDWELATIGDPLTDLGTTWAFTWQTTPEEYGGVLGLNLDSLGIPSAEQFFAAYRAAGGHDAPVLPFHLVLGMLRNAGIFRGIGERAAAGTAASQDAAEAAKLDRVYIGRALAMVEASGG